MSTRVLFVDHSGVLGGAELYLLDLARHFGDACSVALFESGPFMELLVREDLDVVSLDAHERVRGVTRHGGVLEAIRAAGGVFGLIRKMASLARSYDMLYANSQKALVVAGPASRLAGKPLIWNLHDILTADHFSPFHRRLVVFLANMFANRVIVNSEATRRAFVDAGGRKGKTHVVYNGLDPELFEEIQASETQGVRSELGVGDGFLVGVFSRLAPWKGQHVLLNAMAHLPDVHAVVVGDALFEGDHSYETDLRELSRRLGLESRVHFTGFRTDIPVLMNTVDVVVHTSIAAEPFGRVIAEGMLAGKPVVATSMGGALEIIQSGETGILIPAADPERLAETISVLISDPAKAESLATNGQRVARRRFGMKQFLTQIEAHIAQVSIPRHIEPGRSPVPRVQPAEGG